LRPRHVHRTGALCKSPFGCPIRQIKGGRMIALTYAKVNDSLFDDVGHDVAWLEFPREAVEHPSEAVRHELKALVDQIVARCVETRGLIRISVTINGYEDDSRKLFEIPEICTWARTTLDLIPGLWTLLEKDEQTDFTTWSCGPFSRKETESSAFQARCATKRTEYVAAGVVAFAELLKQAGASDDLVKSLYAEAALGLAS